ncbi:MAG TPA: phenylalanine--tRNA ligase subunit alpha [Nitrosopumilaceae archaeon]|nr:phenylalanine--tRNA ligase subunit alpha [Nitrosopumilaceae archaeon]
MSQVLHPIEKQIIKSLKLTKNATPEKLVETTKLSIDQVRRGMEWLKLKGLAEIHETETTFLRLSKNGLEAKNNGLPERKLVNEIKQGPKSFEEIKNVLKSDFNAAIANAKKNDWIQIDKGETTSKITLKGEALLSPEEKLIDFFGTEEKSLNEITDTESLTLLKKRPDFITENSTKLKLISLLEKAKDIDVDSSTEAIDVEAKVPLTNIARIHPLKETINEIREIFVSLGFSEVLGSLTQPSFWNFDALFTPQDHPAREMQDTFYLKDMKAINFASTSQTNQVARSHKKGWKYDWNMSEAQKMTLRTHTTCVTIKHLADNKPDEARVFSLGRVFRNEKVSYKHLAEFNQVEGVVIGKHVTLRDLMGLQEEFYRRIGLTKIKFWPTFFPYTEPSLQSMVYNDRLGKWIELFGMGIFRPEVTKPLGITKPVLAWGGGIERIAMLKYGLDDVREFYNNNLNWLRSATKCQ